MQPPRLCHLARRGTYVLLKQPPELTLTYC
jgi:hypothetical protein